MKGYCPTCREVRSDNGCDVWGMMWKSGMRLLSWSAESGLSS